MRVDPVYFGGSSLLYSLGGEIITQALILSAAGDFTIDFPIASKTGCSLEKRKIRCGIKDQVRIRCGLSDRFSLKEGSGVVSSEIGEFLACSFKTRRCGCFSVMELLADPE